MMPLNSGIGDYSHQCGRGFVPSGVDFADLSQSLPAGLRPTCDLWM